MTKATPIPRAIGLRAYLEQEESRLKTLVDELRAQLMPLEADLFDVRRALAGVNGGHPVTLRKRAKLGVVDMAHAVLESIAPRGMRDMELCAAIDERFNRPTKTRPETVRALLRRAGPSVFVRDSDGWSLVQPPQGRAT